ncbi:MAG: TrkH family potassium uptake protein [Dehalococcoidaceae bacterium]|nr:TrkH family potassium uptake protein [Dehalococcoidaceae bacterium]
MNFVLVRRYISVVTGIVGLAMLLPAVVSVLYSEHSIAFVFLGCVAASLAFSAIMFVGTRRQTGFISHRDAVLVVAGSWLFASIIGALPYYFTSTFSSFVDSLFESVSGFTTTGSSVMTHIAGQSRGILFWRSLTQWLGGMGLITLFVSLFPVFGMGSARMMEAEAPAGQEGEKLHSVVRSATRRLLTIYVVLTLAQVGFLMVSGLPVFDSINISFTSIATGGFAPTNLSIEDYHNGGAEVVIMIFMFLGGINFSLYYWLVFCGQIKKVFSNAEFRLYAFIAFTAVVVVNYDLMANAGMSFGDAVRTGIFNTLSISTTTGYSTVDFNTWPSLSKAVLLMLMVVGGSAGSTAGGMKVIRLLILVKHAHKDLLKFFNPARVLKIKLNGEVLSEKTERRALELILLYMVLLVAGTMAMSALGVEIKAAISSVASCMASVGPGFGQVGPYGNYAEIPAAGKSVLSFLMLAGRVEIYTLLVLFMPSFWKRF